MTRDLALPAPPNCGLCTEAAQETDVTAIEKYFSVLTLNSRLNPLHMTQRQSHNDNTSRMQ